MKYIVVLCDGMSDLPNDKLMGKTPMEVAKKPNMDRLASKGVVGTVATVPENMSPGSDVANLSVMGYDVKKVYTGRSPLEAANIGIHLNDNDVAFRCNLVTLSDEEIFKDKTIIDYCAGDISTKEADEIIKAVQQAFGNNDFSFYTGTAYRHCMVWRNGKLGLETLTPPHDITGKKIKAYLSTHPENKEILSMMEKSYELLKNHPVNKKRIKNGLAPANAIWLWGEGKKPNLEKFQDKYNKLGAVISAVDLIKGIGKLTGQTAYDVEGATGYIDTYYEGKVTAALHALFNGHDFVYLHVEAPDECGHRGEVDNKVRAIEDIDSRVLGPLLSALDKEEEEYRLLLLPDHPTPLSLRTHTRDPVPYLLYDNRDEINKTPVVFTEKTAISANNHTEIGHTLINKLFK